MPDVDPSAILAGIACRWCADTDAGLVCRADLGGQCRQEDERP